MNDGIKLIEEDMTDLVSCASFYITNPNLIEKINMNEKLILPDPDYFYTHGEKGFIEY